MDPTGATTTPLIRSDLDISAGLLINGEMTWDGVLSGNGALTKTRPFTTLLLTATNTYTGGTTISGEYDSTISISRDNNLGDPSAGLTFGSGGRLGLLADMVSTRSIVMAAGIGQIDTSIYSATFTGTMSGGGQFDKRGSGTLILSGNISGSVSFILGAGALILTGTNTFNSFAFIGPDATLGIYRDGNLGDSFIINEGGIFRVLSSTRITKEYAPGYLGTIGTFDTSGFDVAYDGRIVSTFTFIKGGGGTLTVGGDNGGYIGGFRVDDGYLAAASTSAFGSGPLRLNGGGLALGSGNIHAGSFGGTGTLSLLISGATTYGHLTVNTAVLNGTALRITLESYLPPLGSTFTIVAATSISGEFDSISHPAARNFTVSYGSANVILTAADIPFGNSASNVNQAAMAKILDQVRYSASGDLATVISILDQLDSSQLQSVLTQMGPGAFAGLSGMAQPASSAQSMAVSNRLDALRSASSSPRFSYSRVVGRQWYPGISLTAAPGDVESWNQNNSSLWGFYGSVLGSIGALRGNDGTPGYAFNSQGASFGVDYRFLEGVAGGASVAYVRSHAGLDQGGGSIDGDSVKYGVYGTLARDSGYVETYIGGAEDFYQAQRNIVVLSRQAESSPRGRQFNTKTGAGIIVEMDSWKLSPSAALAYDHQVIAPFSERGAGALNLDVRSQVADSLRSSAGLKVSRKLAQFTSYISVAWQHEWREPGRSITAQLANAAGSAFSVRTAGAGRNASLCSLGLEAPLARNLTGSFSYDGEYRKNFVSHGLRGNLRLRF